jgi:hypothetical protein
MNIGNGWSKHMSRSQNKPYLYHHQQNRRYWTEDTLPLGWCFEWENEKKLFRNVLTDVTQISRPTTTEDTSNNLSQPLVEKVIPTTVTAATTTTTTTTTTTATSNVVPTSTSATKEQQEEEQQQQTAMEENGEELGEGGEEGGEDNFDGRLGYPETKPNAPAYSHGWCFKPQKFGLSQVLNEDTMCVVELGSYLGNSAKVIVENAPNAQIYCVDRWDYDFIMKCQKNQYQEYELDIMKNHNLYETFLVNTWDLQERVIDDDGNCAGIIPMRMDTIDALTYLHEGGAYPDVIYIDGDHSTAQVSFFYLLIYNLNCAQTYLSFFF